MSRWYLRGGFWQGSLLEALFARLLRGSVRRLRSAGLRKASKQASEHRGMVLPQSRSQGPRRYTPPQGFSKSTQPATDTTSAALISWRLGLQMLVQRGTYRVARTTATATHPVMAHLHCLGGGRYRSIVIRRNPLAQGSSLGTASRAELRRVCKLIQKNA